MTTVSTTENLNVLKLELAIITLSCRVSQILRLNQNSITSRTELCDNFLTLWAADRELLLVGTLIVQIVRVDVSTVILYGHLRSTLPSKHIEWTLFRIYSWVETTEIEAIESTVDIGWWHSLFRILICFRGKFGLNYKMWRVKIVILVHFD